MELDQIQFHKDGPFQYEQLVLTISSSTSLHLLTSPVGGSLISIKVKKGELILSTPIKLNIDFQLNDELFVEEGNFQAQQCDLDNEEAAIS